MSDGDRQRPRYGEYATPEEQRASIRKPVDPHPDAQTDDVVAPEERRDGTGRPAPTDRAAAGGAPVARSSAASPGRSRDSLLTWVLLALGVLDLLWSAPSYASLTTTLDAVYEQAGLGAYTSPGVASVVGVALLVVRTVIVVLAVVIARRRLRRGVTAFWVPLVGAAVSFAVTVLLLGIAIVVDPAFIESVGSRV